MWQARCAGRIAAGGHVNVACFDRCVTEVGVHLLIEAGRSVVLA
jgi:hypothetical protein